MIPVPVAAEKNINGVAGPSFCLAFCLENFNYDSYYKAAFHIRFKVGSPPDILRRFWETSARLCATNSAVKGLAEMEKVRSQLWQAGYVVFSKPASHKFRGFDRDLGISVSYFHIIFIFFTWSANSIPNSCQNSSFFSVVISFKLLMPYLSEKNFR